MSDGTITAVEVMTIQATLPAPVIFGEWIMHTREFALVRVRDTMKSASGGVSSCTPLRGPSL